MSGEDAYDFGGVTWNFRQRCQCGATNYYEGGKRVEPNCGHDLPSFDLAAAESEEQS